MTHPALTLRHVTKRFGARTALQNVTCEIPPGQSVVFWGPNGAGKTTALRCILGVIPCEGDVYVLGHEVAREGKSARRLIGYVPQELGFHGEQTVRETVAFYARLRRVPSAEAVALLQLWQLGEVASVMVRTLSGGMKQRLALVLALLGDPPVLLLDEPTSHLDARTRHGFVALLERLKQAGKTLVLCSHRAGEALRLADRVLALEAGRLVADGTPEARSCKHRSPWVSSSPPSTGSGP